MTAEERVWFRRIASFAVGLGLFVVMLLIWGREGIRVGRMIAAAVLIVGFVSLVAVIILARRRSRSGGGASDIARLLRTGMVDEAVRTGRELFEKSPGDPHVAWYYVAALMKSGHLAEARRVFAGLRPDALPPKMAALHPEVQRALETKSQAP